MRRPMAVLGLAFLAQNVAIGIPFGSFGLLIGDIADEFNAGRSSVSFGIALVMLAMGVLAPLLGYLLDRWSIRGTMMLGAIVAALGFQLSSRADTLWSYLFSFGVIVGMGITAMGVLPACKLAANWFPENTGKAIGLVSLPVLVAAGPPLFGLYLAEAGWRELLRVFSYAFLLMLPLLWMIRDRPEVAVEPLVPMAEPPAHVAVVNGTSLLLDRRLWLLVPVGGIALSGGIVLVTHIVQHAIGLGISLPRASLLLSVNGVASMCGALLFGWLSDRLSPLRAIIINLCLQTAIWPLLLMQEQLPGLMACAAVAGLCAGGAHPALSALLNRAYGASRFGTMLGLMSMLVLPFTFSAAPLVGYLFDVSGGYTLGFGLVSVIYALVLVLLLISGGKVFGAHEVNTSTSGSGGGAQNSL